MSHTRGSEGMMVWVWKEWTHGLTVSTWQWHHLNRNYLWSVNQQSKYQSNILVLCTLQVFTVEIWIPIWLSTQLAWTVTRLQALSSVSLSWDLKWLELFEYSQEVRIISLKRHTCALNIGQIDNVLQCIAAKHNAVCVYCAVCLSVPQCASMCFNVPQCV